MMEEGLVTARRVGAAVAAVPVKDTVKVVAADGLVERTPDRSLLWLVQTPQVFRHDLLVAAHADRRHDAPRRPPGPPGHPPPLPRRPPSPPGGQGRGGGARTLFMGRKPPRKNPHAPG